MHVTIELFTKKAIQSVIQST